MDSSTMGFMSTTTDSPQRAAHWEIYHQEEQNRALFLNGKEVPT